jgi:hypothetical protein
MAKCSSFLFKSHAFHRDAVRSEAAPLHAIKAYVLVEVYLLPFLATLLQMSYGPSYFMKLVVLLTYYCAGDKSEINKIVGDVARLGELRGVYRGLVGKPKGKRPLGRPRRRWEDNIMVYFLEVRVGAWAGLSWLRIETGGGHL